MNNVKYSNYGSAKLYEKFHRMHSELRILESIDKNGQDKLFFVINLSH